MHRTNGILRRSFSGAVRLLAILCLMFFVAYATLGNEAPLGEGSSSRSPGEDVDESSASDAEKPIERLREGTVLDRELGRFVVRGDRLIFHPANSERPFIGLENLNLERISRQLDNQFEDLDWSVSGQVMEYRGANYLLVTRATLRIRSRDDAK